MCAGAIINARIDRVVYGAADPKAGSCGSLTDLFTLPYNHHPQWEKGLMGEECSRMLTDFFRSLREKLSLLHVPLCIFPISLHYFTIFVLSPLFFIDPVDWFLYNKNYKEVYQV